MNISLVDTFDPSDRATQQCPYAHYQAMRDAPGLPSIDGASVGRPGERVYCVSRHEDVSAVLRDWRTFSSKFGAPSARPSPELLARLQAVDAEGWPNVSTMLTEDPPTHTRFRGLVSKAFTPRRVAELEPTIRDICNDLVGGFAGQPRIEFVQQFGVPLPVRAVAAILQVPDDHQAEFKRWADASVAAIGRRISDDERVAAQRTILDQQRYFADQIEQRRTHPRDDFLTDLLHAELPPTRDTSGGEPVDVPGGRLDMAEMLSIIRQIQVAGSETTTGLMADLMVLFADNPDQWRAVRADPSRSVPVVEEALRIASPNQGLYRIVTHDTVLAGEHLPAWSTVWVMFGAANRDERTFPSPDTFDPDRHGVMNHVAFGKGIHFCLGAALARLEAKVGVETLVNRLDSVRLAPDAVLEYGPSAFLRGLVRLDLDVTYR